MFQAHKSPIQSPRYIINPRNTQTSIENTVPRDCNVEADFAAMPNLSLDTFEGHNYTYSRTGISNSSNTEQAIGNRNSRVSSQMTPQTSPLAYESNNEAETGRHALQDWSESKINATIGREAGLIGKSRTYDLDEELIPYNDVQQELENLAPQNNFEFEPYEYLKICDEMDEFYHGIQNQTFNAFSLEFQHKVRLLRIKLHRVEALLHSDSSEFNFAFRDFMGHFTTLIESADNWKWTAPFIMPFLKARAKKLEVFSSFQTNIFHSFRDVCFVIKNLCNLRAKHMQKVILGTYWIMLVQILALSKTSQMSHVFETLQEIVLNIPPNMFLVEKLIRMRQNAGISCREASEPSMVLFRQYHYELFLTFFSVLDSRCEEHTMYRRLCLEELKLSLNNEADPKLAQFVFTILRKYGNGIKTSSLVLQTKSMMESDDETSNVPLMPIFSPLPSGQISATLRGKDYYSRMNMSRKNLSHRPHYQSYGEQIQSASSKVAKPWSSPSPVISTGPVSVKSSGTHGNSFRGSSMKHGFHMKKSLVDFYNGRIRQRLSRRFTDRSNSTSSA